MAWSTLALAVLAISWGSILVRGCASPPLTISFYRVLLASLLIAPVAASRARRAAAGGDRRGAGVLPAAGVAGLLLALHFAAWMTSLAHTSIAASTVLVSTQPVFSLLLSILFLGERPSGRTVAGIATALAGAVWIAWADLAADHGRLVGDLLALLGAVFAAGYLVVGRAARRSAPFPVYLFQVNLWSALAAGSLALLLGQPLLPTRRADVGWLLLMALVPHLLGHGALNWAVRRVRVYLVNLSVLGEPVLASVYAFLIFGEAPAGAVYGGALLIGAGVALALAEASGGDAGASGGGAAERL